MSRITPSSSTSGNLILPGSLYIMSLKLRHAKISSMIIFGKRLRHKLEADPARPRFLINDPRVGYRLKLGLGKKS
jgi:hypothetical protein